MSFQHIHSYKSAGKSAVERERDLLAASHKYMRGEISVEKLEEIERPYSRNFKEATLEVARQQIRMRRGFLYLVLFWVIVLISLDLIVFFISRSNETLILLPATAFLIYLIVRFLFPSEKKRRADIKPREDG